MSASKIKIKDIRFTILFLILCFSFAVNPIILFSTDQIYSNSRDSPITQQNEKIKDPLISKPIKDELSSITEEREKNSEDVSLNIVSQDQTKGTKEVSPPEIRILRQDCEGLSLSFSLSDINVQNIEDSYGQNYQKLSIAEGGQMVHRGIPELPSKGIYLDVPISANIDISITKSNYVEKIGYNVYPSQKIIAECDDNEVAFEKNASFYDKDEFFPKNIVELKEIGIIRRHRTMLLVIYPVQYNCASKMLRVFKELEIELNYQIGNLIRDNENIKKNNKENHESEEFSSFFESLYLNYEAPLKTKSLDRSQVEADGADYLIITPDEFYEEILPLAQHKSNKGLLTKIVNLTSIGTNPSADEISSYIKDAYDTWSPAPTYLLLVGDSDLFPTHYKTIHPYHGTLTATDLYYATVDGGDYFPDIFTGRLPVKNETELSVVVDKIINYEIGFNQSDPWRRNITMAAYDQYGRFFIDTCENVSSFLETKGYDITKVYTGGSYTGSTQDVIDAINGGTFLVNHRDHGEWYGWGHPYFSVNNINELNNGDILPVMFSINCLSGRFDYSYSDCFAEAILKAENKGVVSVIASTRVSYSGYNDELDKGFFASIYPDYQSSYNNYVGKSAKMGHVLNFGKMYMFDKYVSTDGVGYPWAPSEDATKAEFEMFTLFGDPDMTIFKVDHDLEVNLEIPSNPNITETYKVNATVINAGLKEISDVELSLNCNGQVIKDIDISNLTSGEHGRITYDWTPQIYGAFNFTAYAPPKSSEFYLPNNRVTKFANVRRDLSVQLEAPSITAFEASYLINATISNEGPNTEYGVEFNLSINDEIKNTTYIPNLQSGESNTITYNWTPQSYGIYNISCSTPLRQGEFNIQNNNISVLSRIKRDLMVDLELPLKIFRGESYIINATVTNNGSKNESDVELYLRINNDVKDVICIPNLQLHENYTLSYTWNPQDYGMYNISCDTPRRNGELNFNNNINQKNNTVNPVIFSDNFDNGLANWRAINGLWHFTSIFSPWPNPCHSPNYAMWFGMESTGDFNTGRREYGDVISNSINLSDVNSAFLSFYHWMDKEHSGYYDIGQVFISTNRIDWEEIYRVDYRCEPWEHINLNISKYCGNANVYIRFRFDTRDYLYNYYRGWLIDDVEIYTDDYDYEQKSFQYPSKYPRLTDPTVTPKIAYPDTLIRFRVNYTDFNNDAPTEIRVIINGTYYPMIKQDASDYDYTDGCIYIISSYLPQAAYNYTYWFYCSDGHTNIFIPLMNDLRIHLKPSITDMSVSPKISYGDNPIVFRVNYTDLDNEAPIFIRLVVYFVGHYDMVKQDDQDNDYTDGCIYEVSIELDPKSGNYSYAFYCSDDNTNSISTITNFDLKVHSKPILTTSYPLPTSGYPDVRVAFRIVYTDLDNDAPTQINLVINGTSYVMTKIYYDNNYADGVSYVNYTYLPLSPYSYVYHFNCSDGEHSFETSECNLRIHNKPNLSDLSVSPKRGNENTLISFRVNYSDPDNDTSSSVLVVIDNHPYSLFKENRADVDYVDGCFYVLFLYLDFKVENYTYYFQYSDDGVNSFATSFYNDLSIRQSPPTQNNEDNEGDDNSEDKTDLDELSLFFPLLLTVFSVGCISLIALTLYYKKKEMKTLKNRE
ncbi:MAG: hypothetical protein GF383_10765 [Candidatus Lokiarchaeota archaeon]|nr:hypothetical protein [Candidatus Lokiarchaeota archaeon]MBD3341086.1 hypothetical protein [Candidatus Lokiarchaeota archaeon]